MSGIVGIINYDKKPVERTTLDQMLSAIAHRGPDGREVWMKNNVGLGFVKLETGNVGPQPFALDDRIAVVLDGAIYNRDELREKLEKEGVKFRGESDAELLAYLYSVFEERCLEQINGMFALAIRDETKDITLLARDRIGMKSC